MCFMEISIVYNFHNLWQTKVMKARERKPSFGQTDERTDRRTEKDKG